MAAWARAARAEMLPHMMLPVEQKVVVVRVVTITSTKMVPQEPHQAAVVAVLFPQMVAMVVSVVQEK